MIKRITLSIWGDPYSVFARSTPFYRRFGSAPMVRTFWFFEGCTVHLNGNFLLGGGRFGPVRWNRKYLFIPSERFLVTVLWIVMDKDTAVPAPVERPRPTMEDFGTLASRGVVSVRAPCHVDSRTTPNIPHRTKYRRWSALFHGYFLGNLQSIVAMARHLPTRRYAE